MKKPIKIVLVIIFILFLILWELIREENYLKYKMTTTDFYFTKSANDVIIDGNYLTKAINSNDVFSHPYMTHIKCIYNQNICIENSLQDILGALVFNQFEYKINEIKNDVITAERQSEQMKFILNINLKTKETTIRQIPLQEKTGDILNDIGTTSAISSIVDSYTFMNENKKYNFDFINTPLHYILRF